MFSTAFPPRKIFCVSFFKLPLGITSILFSAVLFLLSQSVFGQQIHLSSPFQKNGASFSESIGSNWGISGKNWFLDVGSPQANHLPRYGGHDMNSDLRGGFQFQRGGVSGYFNGWAGQGNQAFSTTETPSVTFMNGQRAFFQNVTDTPFVISHVPVVGTWYGNAYQPFHDPGVTLSPSLLQQKIDQLELEKKRSQPRYVRETPNAPALKEIQQAPPKNKKSQSSKISQNSKQNSSRSAYSKSANSQSIYSRSANPDTAETPALSVAEMKRRHRERQKQNQD